jgi:hypothetical protein
MQPQRTYQEWVKITQGGEAYNGDYQTKSYWTNNQYVYYLNGRQDDERMHFSVINTGGGKNRLRKFHITVPFPSGNTTANLHVNYEREDSGTVTRDKSFPRSRSDLQREPFLGTTIDEVREAHHSAAEEYLEEHILTLDKVAQEFADNVWRY